MKHITLPLFFGVLAAVGAQTAFAADAKTPKPAAKTAAKASAVAVPAGAKKVDANTWVHTDAAGKQWTYRETPFGIVKIDGAAAPTAGQTPFTGDATPAAASAGSQANTPFGPKSAEGRVDTGASEDITAREDGEIVKFEKPSPFGPFRWSRKKTELTAVERDALERSRKAAQTKGTSRQ